MIYKRITGRLGNQMFQYAALRAYAKRYHNGEKVHLDFRFLEKPEFKDELAYFKANGYVEESKSPKMKFLQKYAMTFGQIFDYFAIKIYGGNSKKRSEIIHKFDVKHAKFFMKRGVFRMWQGYIKFAPSSFGNEIFVGNFESAKYFDEYREEILDEFTPKKPKLEKNKKIYNEMRKTESVCVTIRRGDFVRDDYLRKMHYVCTPEYFERGIAKMEKLVDNPRFFIFSDDIKWVKENMQFPSGSIFEDGSDPVWEKLRLMYSCKHFIISNSTFSWWAQYLSRNDNKVVIAPKKWKNTYQNEDIYQDNWILIDAGKQNG